MTTAGMRILALETSGTSGSVAALEGERLLKAAALDPAGRTARALAPAMRELLRQVGWRPADVQLVAVTAGPGSFTGLRLGVTTAKTFAYAVGCQVLGVNTLEVIASQAPAECSPIGVALDAQRQQLFAAKFERTPAGELTWLVPAHLVTADTWLAERSGGLWITGPILEELADLLPADVRCVDRGFWQPTAEAVGRLALRHHLAGRRDDAFQLVPEYLRRSAAEEKRDAAEEKRDSPQR